MKYHDRIFEIFQRLHRSEEYAGTGVGLAIVRKAIERMGGRVWAESDPQTFTTFYLEVPYRGSEESWQQPA
jgi:light-regulated signal transduction histidine kinase (bacteriophytochrome)